MNNHAKCQICNELISKYKCPACLLRYCSLACYKGHKQSEQCSTVAAEQAATVRAAAAAVSQAQDLQPPSQQQPPSSQSSAALMDKLLLPTQHTVAPQALEQLRTDPELRSLLQRPELRDQLQQLAACDNPQRAGPMMRDWLTNNIEFRRFADSCLSVVAGPDQSTFRDSDADLLERLAQSDG